MDYRFGIAVELCLLNCIFAFYGSCCFRNVFAMIYSKNTSSFVLQIVLCYRRNYCFSVEFIAEYVGKARETDTVRNKWFRLERSASAELN